MRINTDEEQELRGVARVLVDKLVAQLSSVNRQIENLHRDLLVRDSNCGEYLNLYKDRTYMEQRIFAVKNTLLE